MKKIVLLVTVIVGSMCLFGSVPAEATASLYTFDISLEAVVSHDALSGYLGEDDWYQWIYRVDVVPGGEHHNGLSHFTLELCYGEDMLGDIFATIGANGNSPNGGNLLGLTGDALRFYDFEYGEDGSTGVWGLKWDILEDGDDATLDEIGEYDYFWFSAPTSEGELSDALVKYANYEYHELINSPICDDDGCPNVPEPTSLSLLVFGLAGLIKKSFKNGGKK